MPRFDVTVVGELNLDVILYGLPHRLPPEREVLADGLTLTLGSSSAIFAHNLAVLGTKVGFIARVGADPLGEIGLERLGGAGVDVSRVKRTAGATLTGLTVILQHAASRNILTYPGTMFEMTFEDLDLEYLADSRHFHLSSFFLHRALRPRIGELFERMKAAGLSTSLDTNDDPDDQWDSELRHVLHFVDIFLPNSREACKVAGTEDLEEAIERLAGVVPLLVVKLGRDGALARLGTDQIKSPGVKVKPVDPVGAGDSFDAGFLHEYLRGSDLAVCLASGNLAGAYSTTRPGGTEAFRDRESVQEFFAKGGAEEPSSTEPPHGSTRAHR